MTSFIPSSARTDVGQRRDHNEDALVLELPLLAVADGVGGSARGEVASQLALDTLVQHTAAVTRAGSSADAVQAMEHAVLAANAAVHQAHLDDPALRGMATTLTAAVVRDGGEVIVGHVGDSRLYVISAAGARMATDDHSVVAELVRAGRLELAEVAHHPQRNVITRALGPEPEVAVDAFVLHVGPGDWLLACSDGLTEHVTEAELARALLESAKDPDAATQRLVDQANARGGTDNITVVIAQPVPSDVSGELNVQELHAALAASDAQSTSRLPQLAGLSDAPAEASGPLPVVERDVEHSGELPALQPIDVNGAEHDGEGEEFHDPTGVARSRTVRGWLAFITVVIVAAVAGGFLWSQSYFLTERADGRVGIDRGFPFAGLSRSHSTSDVTAEELSAADQERLVDSHRILSRTDAERVVDGLPDRVEAPDGDAATA
ncbi:MAG: Stp1/IreP family PP2C-type Ser/Thr phosphatase [Thermoleophilia bacterium]|nr:Stp1/IreP family PP2C-type Ser/Thr phosphatase [Thermoleophilia bacterium]MCZ4495991.1 Stp1/IreP family PP2C-type Ser/Thr phosphatase [Thermoleophilia bacterium]